MQKRQHIFCGCWDSSPGLHGHNVKFSKLLVQKITVHNAAISSVMSKIVIKHHDRNDPFLCCKREEEKKRFKSKPSTTLAMQKRQHIFCGCWDSSPGLHGHNVEFSPLNYNHMLVKSNQYYKTYRNYVN
ncbi:hypothetical protein GQ457_07G003880 [Hibiscus cannabinus]